MHSMTSKHMLFFIPALSVVAIKTYPTLFTRAGQRDSWIAMIIAVVIIFAFLCYLLMICKKKNCYDFFTIYRTACGKKMGNILLIFFYMTVFLTLLEGTAVEADAMKFNFMLFSPVWGFLLLSVITGFYVVISGYRSVVITVVLGIIFITCTGFLLAGLTQKYKDFARLLPVFENGINQGFLVCLVKLVGSLASFVIIFPMLQDVTDKNNIFKTLVIGLAFTAQIQIFCMIGNITTFEPGVLNTYPFPKITQTQRILHFGVLEAGELFVVLQVIGGWIVKYVTSFFVLDQIFQRLGKKNQPVDFIITILVYGIGCAVAYNLFELFNLLEIYIWIALVNFFIVPILVFGLFALRRKNAETQNTGAQTVYPSDAVNASSH